jgi:hypothetical protein
VAKTQTAWRCSQCGTVNEPGAQKCSGCGKWPSLFDLQNTVEAPVADEPEELEPELFDPELFEPEPFDPETFDPQTYGPKTPAPRSYETVEPETLEPDVDAEDEEESNRRRLRRWAISAIWVIGIIIWFVANVFGDR